MQKSSLTIAIVVTLICLLLPLGGEAAPQIKSFFPSTNVLLGEQIFWIVELHYALWESYKIQAQPLDGVEIKIPDPVVTQEGTEITARYRIGVTPVKLSIAGQPAIIITDTKGQSTVLAGKPILISPISGDSFQVKNPGPLWIQSPVKRTRLWLYLMLLACVGLLIFLAARRYYYRTPRQLLLRDLKRAIADVRKGRLPVPIWRLLRSDMIWGFPAETLTPSELKEKSLSNSTLEPIAECLLHLEAWRYAGGRAAWQAAPVERSLLAALAIVGKSPLSFSGAKQ